ncbi:hypothetical protein, partial [Streptosporangium subroseum]|uniref:hypothetical protein n=1 Tax=Streptosporangium subroseum TaxID=106412 RepID=UPI001C52AAA3
MEFFLVTRRSIVVVQSGLAPIVVSGDRTHRPYRPQHPQDPAHTTSQPHHQRCTPTTTLTKGVQVAVSRRRFMTTVMSGSALAAVSGTQLITALTSGATAAAASPPGDVVGKITVGYQGWFAAPGDGAPINGWWHWSANMNQPPSPANTTIVAWPDMREYTHTYPTAYANLNNGQPATLFSSYDQQTVDTHFRWMRENNIDTAALQRFNPMGGEGPTRDAMATKVRTAAEANGRKFYIMYDVTDWTTMQSEIKTDWTTKMKALTASPAYALQNGKPVVGIWGFGFNDPKRPWAPAPCL